MSLVKSIQRFIKRNEESERGVVFQDNPKSIVEMHDYLNDKELRINYNDPQRPFFYVKVKDGHELVEVGDTVIRSYYMGKRVFKVKKAEENVK